MLHDCRRQCCASMREELEPFQPERPNTDRTSGAAPESSAAPPRCNPSWLPCPLTDRPYLSLLSSLSPPRGKLPLSLPVAADREGRVGRAESKLQEEPLDPRSIHVEDASMARRDDIGVSVFALHVDLSVRIDRRSVDTPFEAVRMIRNTLQRPVRLASAALCFDAMKLPFRHKIGIELGDVKRPRWNAREGADGVARGYGPVRAGVAVEAGFLVIVVVLDHDGI